jgi:hypothetical protein
MPPPQPPLTPTPPPPPPPPPTQITFNLRNKEEQDALFFLNLFQ